MSLSFTINIARQEHIFVRKCDDICSFHQPMRRDNATMVQRMVERLVFVCGSVFSEYEGTANEKDLKLLKSIYVRENISYSSKIKLPYYDYHSPKYASTVQ